MTTTPISTLNSNSFTSLLFTLEWNSEVVRHTDCYFGERANLWRDFFPGNLSDQLIGKTIGDTVSARFSSGELVPNYSKENIFSVLPNYFDRHFMPGIVVEPQIGRYYPIGMLRGIPSIFKENRNPCRCIAIENGKLYFDLNHPLAQRELTFSITVKKIWDKAKEERGGKCNDWFDILSHEGVGLQAYSPNNQINFAHQNPFAFFRSNNELDQQFYQNPRFVSHIDDQAIEIITQLYGRLLQPETCVLDLMSSWQSHIPETMQLTQLTGLGMNAEELAKNPRLTDSLIHDLNQNPHLPFADQSYDAVICTVSVEYLTQPYEIFREVSRVLKPQGWFIVTFSNRWFPPKVINIWRDLHPFEHLSLVLDYFFKANAYQNFSTFTMHGYPRPNNDKHIAETVISDPVFAVWAQKIDQ